MLEIGQELWLIYSTFLYLAMVQPRHPSVKLTFDAYH